MIDDNSRDGGNLVSPKSRNAYMAGLMDGEGSFSIGTTFETGNPHYMVHIRMYNTNPKLINWVIEHFGGKPFWSNKNGGNIEDLKTQRKMCQWFLTGRKAMEAFLLAILPYLVGKREQANLLLRYLRMNGKHDPRTRKILADRISILNNLQDTPTTNTQDGELIRTWQSYPEHHTVTLPKIESELTGNP